MKNILISIIIPVYNAEKYLERCLESLISQLSDNIEIILVDDGSTDHSLELCKKFSANDERITVYSQNNAGSSVARNLGLSKSKGKWILFVDSDDWIESQALGVLQNEIDDSVDVFFFPYYKVRGQHKEKVVCYHMPQDIQEKDFITLQKWALNQYLYSEDYAISSPWTKLYNAAFLRANKLLFKPNVIMGQDKLFNLYVYVKAKKGRYIDFPFYNYRIRENSASKGYDIAIIPKYECLLQGIEEFLKKYNSYGLLDYDFDIRITMALMYYVVRYICNSDNKASYHERKQCFERKIEEEYYRKALFSVKGSDFPVRQRVLFLLMKFNCFAGLNFICKLNDLLTRN